MPSDQPVTITVWHDAKDNPPKPETFRDYWTDQGQALAWSNGMWGNGNLPDEWMPSVWCDPTPPGDDALTFDDLRRVLVRAVQRVEDCETRLNEALVDDHKAIARLRRAIEAAEKNTP